MQSVFSQGELAEGLTKRTIGTLDDSKKTKSQLIAEVSVLRDAFDAISDGFIVFDANDRVVAFNPKHLDLFPSIAHVLALGMPYRDMLTVQIESGQIDAARGREKAWIEDRVKRHQIADGIPREQVFADGRTVRLSEHRTTTGGIVAVRTDITDLKVAQHQLQESEKQYRDLAELNPDAFIIQIDDKVAFANESALRMFRAESIEQLLGMESLQLVHPDFREAVFQTRKQTITSKEQSRYREFSHLRLDGSSFPSEMITGPIVWQGRIGTTNIIHDITARKGAEEALRESEKRFRAIVESSPIPLVITRRSDGTILFANAQVEPVLGIGRDDLIGEKIERFFWDPSIRSARAAAVVEEGYIDRSVVDMRRLDGSRVPTMHSLRSIVFDGVPAIVGVFMDVTAQQNVELDLRRAKEEAEAANASKTQFLAFMSHELRTPLNAIIGFSEMMEQQMFGPLGQEQYSSYVADIHHSGKHLLDLISDILDLSRIEAGHVERDETAVDLVEVIDECIRYVHGRAEEKGISINAHLPDPCPSLTADKRQTKQILLNLLTNAVKFTAIGTSIQVHVEAAQSGDLNIRIVDQGSGIPGDELERILEPFVRLEGTDTSRVDGTGLGLAIVKRFIEGHGGRLKLISEVDRGTEAIVTFPAGRVHCARVTS